MVFSLVSLFPVVFRKHKLYFTMVWATFINVHLKWGEPLLTICPLNYCFPDWEIDGSNPEKDNSLLALSKDLISLYSATITAADCIPIPGIERILKLYWFNLCFNLFNFFVIVIN